MKLKDSQLIKGIGILLMFFHHLYYNVENYTSYELSGLIINSDINYKIAVAAKVCVSLFVFITAYGISTKLKAYSDTNNTKSIYSDICLKSAVKLIKNISCLLLIIIFISYLFNFEHSASSVWGASLLKKIIGFVTNALGVAGLFNIPLYASSWWYIRLALLLIALIPVLYKAVCKFGGASILLLSLFIIQSLGFNTTTDGLPRYLLVTVLGIVFAEYNIIEKVENYLNNNKALKSLTVILLILSVPVIIIIRSHTSSKYLVDAVMTLVIVLIANLFIRYIPIVRTILSSFGKYSLQMWLIHSFFTVYWFREFTYSFKNIWLILSVLTICTFTISYIYTNFSRIFNLDVIKKLYSSNKGMVVLSIVTAVICFAIALTSSKLGYHTNDDASIANMLSGNITGTPYITHQFINIILGAFISSLYRLFPVVQWWVLYSFFIIALGLLITHFCIYKLCSKAKISLKAAVSLNMVLDISLLTLPISNISFTIVPGILGAALSLLLFTSSKVKNRKTEILTAIAVTSGYILVLIHRAQTAYVILCYILLGILYKLTDQSKITKKLIFKYVIICISFILVTFSLITINKIFTEQINGSEYIEFNNAKVKFMDYPHYSYNDNPKSYNSVGWDSDLYYLTVGQWFFMDDKINMENLTYLSESNSISININTIYNRLSSGLRAILKGTNCRAVISIWLSATLISLLIICICKNLRAFIFFCLNNIGTIILILYQLIMGRVLFRAVFIVLLPSILINISLSLIDNKLKEKEKKTISCVFAAVILICAIPVLQSVFNPSPNISREYGINKLHKVKEYVADNSDNIYIYPTSLISDLDTDLLMKHNMPLNMIAWGGSTVYTDAYKKRLEINGIGSYSCEILKNDNVYMLLNSSNKSLIIHFYKYLETKYNVKGFIITDRLEDSTNVYKFIFDDTINEYDSYYSVTDNKLIEIKN